MGLALDGSAFGLPDDLGGGGYAPPFKRVAKKCFANGVTASPKITQILAFFVWVYASGHELCGGGVFALSLDSVWSSWAWIRGPLLWFSR
jgi:hypothetical protein